MKRLLQLVLIAASTGAGAVFGRYALMPLALPLARLLSNPEQSKHDLGGMVGFFFVSGYNLGLLAGVIMTFAILAGFLAGLALARRVGNPPSHGPCAEAHG